jgi:hypothetical protein
MIISAATGGSLRRRVRRTLFDDPTRNEFPPAGIWHLNEMVLHLEAAIKLWSAAA